VVICKPGKDYYTKLKTYCSISLHSCIGTVVETVFGWLLPEEAGRRGQLGDGKFGSWKGRSAIVAAAFVGHHAHVAWVNGQINRRASNGH